MRIVLAVDGSPVSIRAARHVASLHKQLADKPEVIVLYADAPLLRSVAGVLGVRYRQLADGEFNHTSALVLLDRDGRIVARTEKIGSVVDPEFIAAVHRALK